MAPPHNVQSQRPRPADHLESLITESPVTRPAIVPLAGIVWDRWRGGRGVLGGALGGAVEAGFALMWVITGPHMPGQMGPSYIANNPFLVVFWIAGFLTFGTLMGAATWLVAAAMGRSVAPPCRAPTTDSCANGEIWMERTDRGQAEPGCGTDAR